MMNAEQRTSSNPLTLPATGPPPQMETSPQTTVLPTTEEEDSPLLVRFLMLWAKPLFAKGYDLHKTQKASGIAYAMLLHPPHAENVNMAYDQFAPAWAREVEEAAKEDRDPRLVRVLFRTFKHYLLVGAALRLVSLVNLLSPFILKFLIEWLQDLANPNSTVPKWHGFGLSLLLFTVLNMSSILQNESTRFTGKAFSQMRAAVAGAMFNQALKLPNDHGLTGFISQMHSTDSYRIQDPYLLFQTLWAHPLTLLLALVALYFFIGLGGVCLAGLIIVVLVFQAFCTARAASQRVLFSKHTDKRSSLLREIIRGIRVIKYCVMEMSLLEKMKAIRDAEIVNILKSFYWRSALDITGAYFPVLTTFFVFVVSSKLGSTVSTSNMFPTMTMIMICRLPVYQLAMSARYMTDFNISLGRVLRLLTYDVRDNPNKGENDTTSSSASTEANPNHHDKTHDSAIVMQSVTIECVKPEGVQTLMSDINLEIPEGELTIICGPTGSGKSLLLLAMMHEALLKGGSVVTTKPGASFAYVSQVPFLRNRSLKENITMSFGKKNTTTSVSIDEERYKRAVETAQLEADFDVLADRDETVVTSGGSNLSGGQRQRISIARAAYSQNPIVTLDDPLSALDPGVGARVFKQCIMSQMTGRTRVLVTHNTSLLHSAARIIIVDQLAVVFCGTMAEMQESEHPTVARYFKDARASSTETPCTPLSADAAQQEAPVIRKAKSFKKVLSSMKFRVAIAFMGAQKERKASVLDTYRVTCASTVEEIEKAKMAIAQSFAPTGDGGDDHHNHVDEDHAPVVSGAKPTSGSPAGSPPPSSSVTSSSSWAMMWYYEINNWLNLFLVIIFSIGVRGAMIATDLILTYWAGRKKIFGQGSLPLSNADYIQWYGIGIAVVFVLMMLRERIAISGSTNVVKNSQQLMMKSIILAPVSFFESTPIGSITSRFSSDLEVCDLKMSQVMNPLITALVTALGSFALMCFAVPYMSAFLVFFAAIYVALLWFYQCTNGLLKRLEAKNREPMVSMMSETLEGLAVLRAYGCEKALSAEHMERYELSARSVYNARVSREWVTIRLELMNNLVVLLMALASCTLMAVYDSSQRQQQLSNVSLGITYAIALGQYMIVLSNRIVDSQSQLRNVERVAEFAARIDPEPRHVQSQEVIPSAEWPQFGAIEFRHVSARYRDGLPLALHSLTFSVPAGQHVGLVGRSGSGKSTVTQALFRMIEPCEGTISIDGLDLSAVDLSEIRSRVAMIAQDPILFSGTVRSNLDPHKEHSDEKISSVLSRVINVAKGIDLSSPVSDGGSNYSVGQRQMICLARAMLRECRIVVLDEATANVDEHTATAMQRIIASDFKHCTTITIAHRLDSVTSGDRILVLDKGAVIEDGSPQELMSNKSSVFSQMLESMHSN